ncbi:hypothetical protein BURK2_01045 [Burkholderiales bacterium]|nr:MAG: hypothetical protein F9K47_11355 [Burkholderiales bacterium]CAG0966804.1 hypothetical protein BURK2_01045 [Burkholderiales bacterium]
MPEVLLLVGLGAALFATLVALLARQRRALRRMTLREELMREVASGIREYFRRSQTEVAVECVSRQDDAAILALIDSAPQARFRYSHIIEIGLRSHVKKVFGLDLARVYWRFPIPEVPAPKHTDPSATPSMGKPLEEVARGPAAREDRALTEDAYLNTRALKKKLGSEYEVTNTSWEQFEAARRHDEPER